jgi:ArsR family transcriptional regulator, arsenate/arsenite/antimonite-responsive transcriptional repressor
MDVIEALQALSALSNETRLWVFRLLVQAGHDGMTAGEIAEHLSSRQNTMSSHLKFLSQAGLVKSHREGRHIRYRADYDTIQGLVLFLVEDCCQGKAEVCRPVAESLAV